MPQKSVSCALCQCIFGEAPALINILPINRVLVCGKPLGNIMDFAPMLNVMTFVKCKAPTHPLVILTGSAPCIPITVPWIPTSPPTVMIGTAPSLNMEYKTMCAWSGIIEIKMPGQFTVT